MSATSYALEELELTFNEDLNGDGTTGPTTTPIATNGTTTLAQVANQYQLNPAGAETGPFLEFNGGPVTTTSFPAGWTPVGAVQTGDGYEVAFKSTAGTYVVWNVGSNGDYTSNATGILSGTSSELADVEAAFGDGKFAGAGVDPATPTEIATNGTTTLAELEVGGLSQNGDAYELNPLGGTGGPLLELNGSVVTKGQFPAGWTPVGARQTGNGYEVAFKSTAGTYVVWNTDSNGDYTGNATGIVSGTSSTLEGVEANFGETFAGARGPSPTNEIGSNGQLARVGNVYELNPAGGGTGPLLKTNGSVVTTGQFAAGWTPVGAKQTGDGYEVAFKSTAGTYVVWNTDSNGNYTGNATGILSSTNSTQAQELEGLEANFVENFATGLTATMPTLIKANSTTALELIGNLFELNPTSGGTGPLLELDGAAITADQFAAGWTPVGAEQTATGYEVAWGILAADQYVVWNTDSNGNYMSNATGIVSGQDFTLEDLNPSFGENLNGAPSLSAILVTEPISGNNVNLSAQTQNTTIDLGGNAARATGPGLDVAGASSSPTFTGTPFAITLGANQDIVEYGLAPSSGIETIANFVLGQDELNISMRGAPDSALQFADMTIGGQHAVGIYSLADPAHGVVLLDLPTNETASALKNNHTMFEGPVNLSHALIG